MALDLDTLLASLHGAPDKRPPVEQWRPAVSGTIDIVIDEQMHWFHEGTGFEREALVKLLASILRREGDQYFLVTPAEKMAIHVADVPFKIIAMLVHQGLWYLISNVEDRIALDHRANWQLRTYQGVDVPYVEVRNGLFARVDRAVYYQMAELAEQDEKGNLVLVSGTNRFLLGSIDG